MSTDPNLGDEDCLMLVAEASTGCDGGDDTGGSCGRFQYSSSIELRKFLC